MTFNAHGIGSYFQASAAFWVGVTLIAYAVAVATYSRTGRNPIANPVLISVTLIIPVLLVTDTPYQTYFDGTQLVHRLLGPAIVAMAVPVHAQLTRLKSNLIPLTVALCVGSITAITSAVAVGWLFGASTETLLSLAVKSTTMPIAMGVTETIGGTPSLTSLTVTLTGISAVLIARPLLHLARIDDPAVRGFALGLTGHGIGTAYALQLSEVSGAFSALGMGLNGVLTTLLVPLLLSVARILRS